MAYFVATSSPFSGRLLSALVAGIALVSVSGTNLYPAVAQAAPVQARAQEPVQAKAQEQTAPRRGSPDLESGVASLLKYAETVNIRIPGNRILTGEYRVSPDGTISLPGIGRLSVANMSVTGFEHLLKSEIFRLSNRESNVAVEIETYRSIFVSGTVLRAGAFPWKPGLSVLQAETLAGGLAHSPILQSGQPIITNPLTMRHEQERIGRAAYDLAAALATIERLRTEGNGGSVYITPERISNLVGADELNRLAARQQALLKSRSAEFVARVRALQNSKLLASNEKNALELQRIRLKEQLVSRNALRARVKRMAKEGYSRADRVFEEQVRIAQLEERLTTTTLGIARMTMAEVTAKQNLETLVKSRESALDLELLDLEQKVGRLEIRLKNVRKVQLKANKQSDRMIGLPGFERRTPRYEIVRTRAGKSVVLKAHRTTPLQPGDVLVVSWLN